LAFSNHLLHSRNIDFFEIRRIGGSSQPNTILRQPDIFLRHPPKLTADPEYFAPSFQFIVAEACCAGAATLVERDKVLVCVNFARVCVRLTLLKTEISHFIGKPPRHGVC
jgi:hypothetical protein